MVLSGQFTGAHAVILGTDEDYLKHAIFGEKSELGFDYMKRFGLAPEWSLLDTVFIANINGDLVALNERELKADKKAKAESKPKTEKKEGK